MLRTGWGAARYILASSFVVSLVTSFGRIVAVEFYATVAHSTFVTSRGGER